VLITHNLAIAPMGDRLIRMRNGRVEEITENPRPTPVERSRGEIMKHSIWKMSVREIGSTLNGFWRSW
jgi:ABC-type sulfate/molybdate transport systems ATPase subunit